MARLIHRIWAGGPMPDEYRAFGESWLDLNPDAELRDWNEEEILETSWRNSEIVADLYRRDDGRRRPALFAQLADVVSYEILERFGGVYVNTDVEPIRPLTVLEGRFGTAARDWAASEDARFLVNAAMGGPAGSDFFRTVSKRLADRYLANPGGPMNRTTGPWLLTETADDFPYVVRLPVPVFCPFHWKTISPGSDARGRKIPDETIAVHHWGHRRDGRTNTIEKG